MLNMVVKLLLRHPGKRGKQYSNITSWNLEPEKKSDFRDFPGGPVVDFRLLLQEAWVQSLVGKLRSHMS